MSLFDDPPLHDFPDRAIRRLLENPANLRDLLASLLPDLVDRLDFDRIEPVGREFLLEDWRRRESDLLFRLPFRTDPNAWTVICVLLEHQSEPDPPMPLRVLLYAVLFWESEWKAWEAGHETGQPLRLTPVIPIVFHTGSRRWRTYRELTELIGGPEELRAFAPVWRPLFWDLAERTPEELLSASGEWLAALAVVRAERAGSEAFRGVFQSVLQRLEGLSDSERMRWRDLLWFLLSWALRRRPSADRESLLDAARKSQMDVKHQEEVAEVGETVEETWEQELLRRGEARGEARGRAQGEACGETRGEARGDLNARREDLRLLLEEKFGPLPESVAQQIDAIDDPARLRDAMRQVLHVSALTELKL